VCIAQAAAAVLACVETSRRRVAPDVVGEYIGVEVDALDGIYRMAEAKLEAAVSSVGTRGEVAAD
jgi:hypothetical protein